jgi:hypothetical protein
MDNKINVDERHPYIKLRFREETRLEALNFLLDKREVEPFIDDRIKKMRCLITPFDLSLLYLVGERYNEDPLIGPVYREVVEKISGANNVRNAMVDLMGDW